MRNPLSIETACVPKRRALTPLAVLTIALVTLAAGCSSAESAPIIYRSDAAGSFDIFATDRSGENTLNLTKSPQDERSPVVSPNRRLIAFLSDSDSGGGVSVDVIDARGENRVRAYEAERDVVSHIWSPDSRRLALLVENAEESIAITTRADGAESANLTSIAGLDIGSWAKTGSAIAFSALEDDWSGIYVASPDGVNEYRLSDGADSEPRFSPNSRQIAFVSEVDGGSDVFVMNADGADKRRVTETSGDVFDIAWSPNGRLIAFVSDQDGNPEIYVVGRDGSNMKRLTSNKVDDIQPTWSPTGKDIAFVSRLDGDADIFIMKPDGAEQRRVTRNDAEDLDPSW